MKIISTKKIILAVITAVVLIAALPIIQSCSNEDSVLNFDYQSLSKTKTITKSDVPLNIGSLKFNSKEEASIFIDELEKAFNQPTQNNFKINGPRTILSFGKKSNNLSKSSIRFKAPTNETQKEDGFLTFSLNINFAYDPSNKSQNPTATVSISGFHPGVQFVQTASSCVWNTNSNCYSYCVSGNLEAYVQIGGQWILYSSPYTYKGSNCI